MLKATNSETTETSKRTPRRRAAKATPVEEVSDRVPTPRPRRKAPTKLESEPESSVSSSARAPLVKIRRGLYIKAGLLVTSFAAAAVIGYSDEGQINIKSLIDERNSEIVSDNAAAQSEAREGEVAPVTAMIPVQNNTSALPDGGLRSNDTLPEAMSAPIVVESTVASSTASTTDAVASSTESGTETATTTPSDSV